MGLAEKIRNSITTKFVTYSLAGMLTLGYSTPLKLEEKVDLKDKTEISELCECWNKTYRKGNWGNIGEDITIDKQGQLYTVGYYSMEDDYTQFIVFKHDNDGKLLKEIQIWKEKSDKIDIKDITRIVVDSEENIYVSSQIKNKDPDIRLLKLNKDGKQSWENVYNSGDYDENGAMAIDDEDNIYVGGKSCKDECNHLIIKYDKKGKKVWEKRYNYGYGSIGSMVIDNSGDIITVGDSSIFIKPEIVIPEGWKVIEGNLKEFRSTEYHLLIAKYSRNGEKIWHKEHKSRRANDVDIDKDNNLYVVGEDQNGITLLKYNEKGDLIWEKAYSTSNFLDDIVIDDDRNLYVLNSDSLIVFDTNGNKVKNLGLSNSGNKLIADNKGNLYLTGSVIGHPTQGVHILVSKLCTSCEDLSEIENCREECEKEEDICINECSSISNKLMAGESINCEDKNLFNCITSCWPKCSETSEVCQDKCGSGEKLEVFDDRYQGLEAKVMIEEFADFECPFSAEILPTLKKIKSEYPVDIRVIYKHSPRKSHKFAFKAAEASECARDQGKFWEYHDKLFENQNALDIDSLKQYASDLRLNTEQFNECLDLGIKKRIIKKDIEEGEKMEIMGVPTFFINDVTFIGVQDIEEFYSVIDGYLGGPKPRLIWNSIYDSGDDDRGNDLVVDKDGNIYVIGYTDVATKRNGILLKYNGDGNLLWKRIYNNNYDNELIKVALDDFSNIYITGWAYKDNDNYISTIGYDENGELLWDKSYDSGKDEEVRGIVADRSKNVYIAGILKNGESSDCLLVKYNKDGKLKWSKIYDAEFKDDILDLVLDDNQNITLAVESYKEEDDSSNKKLRLVKFNKEGNILEDKIIEELPNNLNSLPVDNLGYEYEIVNASGFEDKDFTITKMFKDREIWEKPFNSEYQDVPVAIRIDNSNNIYVLSYFYNNDENGDIRVIKLKQPEIKINCNEQCNLNYSNCMNDSGYSVFDCEEEKEYCSSKCTDEDDE